MNIETCSRRRRSTLIVTAACVAATALVAAGCGGSTSSSAPPKQGVAGTTHTTTAMVTTRMIKGLGPVLVNNRGFTLYVFAPDEHKNVTCTASCATVWPPLQAMTGQKPTAGGAAQTSKLGSDKNPAGGSVVTYAGWPLYTYTADTQPGEATGQGLDLNGGVWHVLSPSGMVIMGKAGSGSGSMGGGGGGSTTGGGGGSSWG
jgi:predicted lipoprotein with Yx(FWY)xxD motif